MQKKKVRWNERATEKSSEKQASITEPNKKPIIE